MLKGTDVFLAGLTNDSVGSTLRFLAHELVPAHLLVTEGSDSLLHVCFCCKLFHTWSTFSRLDHQRLSTSLLWPCLGLAMSSLKIAKLVEGLLEAHVGHFLVDVMPRNMASNAVSYYLYIISWSLCFLRRGCTE